MLWSMPTTEPTRSVSGDEALLVAGCHKFPHQGITIAGRRLEEVPRIFSEKGG